MKKRDLTDGKKSKAFIGMPIYTLEKGKRLGTVKDVIYDGERSKLIAFTLEEPGLISPERRILPFDKVGSIGRDAIMIEKDDVLIETKDYPEEARQLSQKGTLIGKRVITQSGNILGNITDILIDEDTGKAISFEVSGGVARDIGTGRNYVGAPEVVNLGEDAVIVPDNTEVVFTEQEPGGLAGAYKTTVSGAYGYTGERLRGSVVPRDVMDDEGNVVIPRGTVVDDETLELAQSTGLMSRLASTVLGEQARGGAESFWTEARERVSEAWANVTESTRDASSRASRRRAESEQVNFLRGKISATDVTDDMGNILLREGEVISPLILDNLDRSGKLSEVRVKPGGGTVEEEEPTVHIVVEDTEEHSRHKTE